MLMNESSPMQTQRQRLCRQSTRRIPQRNVSSMIIAVLVFPSLYPTLIHGQTTDCARGVNGWAAGPECKSYYWCSGGSRASIEYNCSDGMIFDVSSASCKNSDEVVCTVTRTTTTTTTTIATAPPSTAAPTLPVTARPTPSPTKLGEPIYYGDFRTSSCKSILDLDKQPDWISEDHMFQTKERCCSNMYNWLSLENCLGYGYVETNFIVGSRPPTVAPSASPSSPSIIVSPTYRAPMSRLRIRPEEETIPIEKKTRSDEHSDNFLAELLNWANADLDSHLETENGGSSFSISDLTLHVIADANISEQRPDLNFGSNGVLAVDGGANGERFDSLLKFDVGLILADNSRPMERAVLHVHAASGCLDGGIFTITKSVSWDEKMVTWTSAPESDGQVIGALDQLSDQTWYELDLLPALSSFGSTKQQMSIRISTVEADRCLYSSLQSSKAPYIEIKYKQSRQKKQRPTSTNVEEEQVTEHNKAVEVQRALPVGQFLLLRATDDATLDAYDPFANLSKDATLKTAYHPATQQRLDFIIRFDLSEIVSSPTNIRSAILTVFAERGCNSAGTFSLTEKGESWSEDNISWSSAPAYANNEDIMVIGPFGSVTAHWNGFDATKAVSHAIQEKKTAVTFRVSMGADSECEYSSIQSGRDPKLMITF